MAAEEPQGLLYVEMECPPGFEGEFHAWYNTEHVPERRTVPGFLNTRRYVALSGTPLWHATYDLASPSVLDSPAYKQLVTPGPTPWTRWITSRVRAHRGVYETLWSAVPGAGLSNDSCPGLLAVKYVAREGDAARVDGWHDREFGPELAKLTGVVSARRYRSLNRGKEQEKLVLYGLADPWVTQSPDFARAWELGWGAVRGSLASCQQVLAALILPVR